LPTAKCHYSVCCTASGTSLTSTRHQPWSGLASTTQLLADLKAELHIHWQSIAAGKHRCYSILPDIWLDTDAERAVERACGRLRDCTGSRAALATVHVQMC
jgi:hypothetical protein